MRRAARNCSPLRGLLALALCAPPAALSRPDTARAQPPQDPPAPAEPSPADERARLEAIYSDANQAQENGDFAAAADKYAEALALLPESQQNHESRALALLDTIRARREAHARTRDPLQLCLARDLLRAYLLTARITYGTASAELDGPRQAGPIHGEVEGQLATLTDDLPGGTCPSDQPEVVAPAPAPKQLDPPRPPPPRPDPRIVAGYTLLGVAGGSLALMGLGLGLGAAAESHGRELHMADPALDIDGVLADGFYQRGLAANRLAIAGGVLAGVALITGAALLISARVRPRRPAAGTPTAALGPLGLGLRF